MEEKEEKEYGGWNLGTRSSRVLRVKFYNFHLALRKKVESKRRYKFF